MKTGHGFWINLSNGFAAIFMFGGDKPLVMTVYSVILKNSLDQPNHRFLLKTIVPDGELFLQTTHKIVGKCLPDLFRAEWTIR